MAKNLRVGATVYQVRDMVLHQGVVEEVSCGGACKVMWLKPDTAWKGTSTREYPCDLYRTPKRAILAYLRRIKRYLEIQQLELRD